MKLFREVTHETDYVMVVSEHHDSAWLEPIEITEEVKKQIELIEDLHPYKEAGNKDSYSEYAEGWTDACAILGEAILNLIKGE